MRAQRNSVTVVAAVASSAMALSLLLAGCTEEAGPDERTPTATSPSGAPSASSTSDGTQRDADLATTQFSIAWKDAVATAMTNVDGRLAEIELGWSRDRYAYTIELVSDSEEYEVRIDADTGEQVSEHTERIEPDDLAEKQAEVVDLDRVVSWDQALATALDARSGTVNEWKLEGTKHGPQYQFDIDDDSGQDYEVTIDATTGDLLGVDD